MAAIAGLNRSDIAVVAGVANGSDTSIVSGKGFTAVRRSAGLYAVMFTPPFGGRPAVVAKVVDPNNISSTGANSKENAVVVAVQPNQVVIKTGDSSGTAADKIFSFIAIGPVGDYALSTTVTLFGVGVDNTGAKAVGPDSITTSKVNTGLYDINFNGPTFTQAPVVVPVETVNQNFTADGGSTLKNALTVGISTTKTRIKIGDSSGNGDSHGTRVLIAGYESNTWSAGVTKLVWGAVTADPTIKTGTGYSVVLAETGVYEVVFYTPFSSEPTVVVTQNWSGDNPTNEDNITAVGGVPTDNAILIKSDKHRFRVQLGKQDGTAANRSFEFIVIGK